MSRTATMDCDEVAPRERVAYWSHWIDRLFQRLRSFRQGVGVAPSRYRNAARSRDI